MTFRLLMTKKDPRRTDFVLVGDDTARGRPNPPPVYTSDTTHYTRPRNGARATTTVTRTDPSGDRFQVGVIEWPVHVNDPVPVVVGTRVVRMSKSGIYTSPERFTAADGHTYEWQIRDARPQLVPLWTHTPEASSLFIPPEGVAILDDIVVTFIYFECKWRDKEGEKARASLSSPI